MRPVRLKAPPRKSGRAKGSPPPVVKELFLHIGGQKTGSTSIQAAAALNRDRLLRDGILYPRTPGAKNHIKLTLFSWDGGKTNHLPIAAGLADGEAYQKFKGEFVGDLRAEIARSGATKVLLSNEHLSSRLKQPGQLARLADALRALAETIVIVVYLRPQHELLLSSYSTSIKGGITHDIKLPKNDQTFYYNYDWMLSLWADAFGEENLTVRVFDRQELQGGDVVRDLFAMTGYSPTDDFVFPSLQNPSLDAKALHFLRAFNAHIPTFAGDDNNPERSDIIPALEAISTGSGFGLPAAKLRAIVQMFEPSNANVARRYLGRSDGVLFSHLNFERATAEASPLTVEDAVRLAAHLWQWKQRQLVDTRKRLAAVTKTAAAQDDPQLLESAE
jgi:hypothetical protein